MNELTMHRELARHFARHARLYRGGLAALAGQVLLLPLAWFVGPTWLALAGTIALFIGGLLWPLPSQEPVARATIREQIGYVYDTALSRPTTDDYGFWDEVQREARYRERAVTLPELPQWWVPLLLTAVLVSAIPFAISVAPTPVAQFTATAVDTPEAAAPDDEPVATPNEPEAADPRTPEPPTPPESPSTPGTPQESRAAIDDFLADLAYAPDDAPLSDETGELGEGIEQYEQLADDTAYTELEAAPGDELAEQPDEDLDGGVAELDEAEEDLDDSGALGMESGLGDGDAGDEQGGQEMEADDEMGLSPGDEDDPGGAGDGAGTPRYSDDNERLEGLPDDPEFLGGITDGTMERSGSVRVEGADETFGLPSRALSSYEQAIEEELLGGSLPVPYQETVRKFFQ